MEEGRLGTVGAQKREVIPLPGKDKNGLHIGSVIKPGLEG